MNIVQSWQTTTKKNTGKKSTEVKKYFMLLNFIAKLI